MMKPHFSTGDSGVARLSTATKPAKRIAWMNQSVMMPGSMHPSAVWEREG